MRLVISVQINEAVVKIPLNHLQPPPSSLSSPTSPTSSSPPSSSSSSSQSSKTTPLKSSTSSSCKDEGPFKDKKPPKKRANLIKGVVVTVTGLVYSSVWPEHASVTEGVTQLTVNHVNVLDYIGVKKTCLVRTKQSLDSDDKPIFINLLPRGVKEQSQHDMENLPGVSIIYKKESNWPPPPCGQRSRHQDRVSHMSFGNHSQSRRIQRPYILRLWRVGSEMDEWTMGGGDTMVDWIVCTTRGAQRV